MRDGMEPEVDGVDHRDRPSLKDEQDQRFLDRVASGSQHSLTDEEAQRFLDRVASGAQRSGTRQAVDRDWRDPDARRDWYEERISNPQHLVPERHPGPAYDYQRRHAGPSQVRLEGGGREILADGLSLDPDTVVAVETKYVVNPGKRSVYEGGRPDFLYREFDEEMERYAAVARDSANPVERIRIITSTAKAAAFLSARAHRIVGTDVDIDTIVRP